MKQSTIDPSYRYSRLVIRRFRKVAAAVELLQALAMRPQTYAPTSKQEVLMFSKWKVELDLLEACFAPAPGLPTPQRKDFITQFEFDDAPTSKQNANFVRVGSQRFTKLLAALANMSSAAFPPYTSTSEERKAIISALRGQYEATRALFLPNQLTVDLLASLDVPSYSILSQNVNGKVGARSGASLRNDVIPALDTLKEAPDVLAFNEVFKTKDFSFFVDTLKDANYRVLTDPRHSSTHNNECVLCLGPRIISLREKLQTYYPEAPTGCDYIATVLSLYSGVRLGIASIRLHPALPESEYQLHRQRGDLAAASYKDMATNALPELDKMIRRLKTAGADIITLLGDHNHGRIIPSDDYSGVIQAPVSESIQRKRLKKQNLILKKPQTGGSIIYTGKSGAQTPIADDHLTISPSIVVNSLDYHWFDSPMLDHAALCTQLTFPTSLSATSTELNI